MGLFDHGDPDNGSSSKHNHTCPTPEYTNPEQVNLIGNLSFHQLIVIVSGASLAFSCLICFFLIFRHATHYSIPKEQRQIIRIVFMIPVFAACSFLSITFYDAAVYLKPIDDLYEAFALASFFLLLCTFVQDDAIERQTFITSSGTTEQYTAATIGAFQFPVVMLVLLIVTEITEATGSYCSTSNKVYFAHIWVTIITLFSTTVAIISILKFYKALKTAINHRKPLSKLAIFSFLTSSNDLKPTEHYTFKDLSVGIPNLFLSLEMVIFSMLFLRIYRTSDYIRKKGASATPLGHGRYRGGLLGFRAYGEAFNILDILQGVLSVPITFANRKRGVNEGKVLSTDSEYENARMVSQNRQNSPRVQGYHVPPENAGYRH